MVPQEHMKNMRTIVNSLSDVQCQHMSFFET